MNVDLPRPHVRATCSSNYWMQQLARGLSMHDLDNVVKYLNVGYDSISFVCMSVCMCVSQSFSVHAACLHA